MSSIDDLQQPVVGLPCCNSRPSVDDSRRKDATDTGCRFVGARRDLLIRQGAEWVGDDHRFEPLGAERRALNLSFVQERVRDDDGSGNPSSFQPDRVVQTARRAGPSITDRGDYRVGFPCNPVQQLRVRCPREALLRVVPHLGERHVVAEARDRRP